MKILSSGCHKAMYNILHWNQHVFFLFYAQSQFLSTVHETSKSVTVYDIALILLFQIGSKSMWLWTLPTTHPTPCTFCFS